MKFNRYLLEASKIYRQDVEMIKAAWPKVEKSCAPFLKELRRCSKENLLLRGIGGKYSDKILHVKTLKGTRTPKDMDHRLSEYIDDLFFKKFHLRPRSEGFFGAGGFSTVKSYGYVHIIFPVGQYEYLWSPDVRDLYSDFQDDATSNWELLVDKVFDNYGYLNSEYEDSYGEETGNGHWKYKYFESNEDNRNDATIEIANKIAEKELDSENEDYEEKLKALRDTIFYDIEWYPDVSYEDYVDEYARERRDEAEDKIGDMIKSYKNNKLCEALDHQNHEIMVICKRFYCFFHNEAVEKLIKDMVFA